jgi:uncharacterized membrane protein
MLARLSNRGYFMNEGQDRGSLEGPPASMTPQAPPAATKPQSGGTPTSAAPAAASSFDFNQPTIISLLYLSSFILGVTSIVGVVLAYVWKGEAKSESEVSHYQYLINTFWIGLVGGFISVILMIALIGFLLLPAVAVLVVVRCVLSLINAQKQMPMPNPGTLLA